MAFQDFDLITEKRKNDRKQKLKRRIAIGAVCTIVVIGLIGAAAFVIVSNNSEEDSEVNDHSKKTPSSSSSSKSNPNQISVAEKLVKTICSSTDYQDKCETSLTKEVKKDPKIAQPKDILKLAISVAQEEVNKAMNKTNDLNFQTDNEKGAYEDCKKLLDRAKDDLGNSSSHVGSLDMTKLTISSSDLNSWLSAVIAFHGACLDGFSEGKLKTEMQTAFQDSMEYVSNALAILSQLGSVFSSVLKNGASRHLLSSSDDKGIPEWMNDEDRRMLKAADDKPTPNVTVARDGSGDFKTISEALKAIPQKYDGRYIHTDIHMHALIYGFIMLNELY